MALCKIGSSAQITRTRIFRKAFKINPDIFSSVKSKLQIEAVYLYHVTHYKVMLQVLPIKLLYTVKTCNIYTYET